MRRSGSSRGGFSGGGFRRPSRSGRAASSGWSGGIDKTAACSRALRLGEQYLNDGRLDRAYNMLIRASRYSPNGGQQSKAQKLETELKDSAEQTLNDADQQYEQGQYVAALQSYRVVANMKKLKVAATAKKRIAEARKDPARRAEILEARAARLFEEVESLKAWLSPTHRADSSRAAELEAELLLATLEEEKPDCSGCEDCQAWEKLSPAQREARIKADRLVMGRILEKIVTKYEDTPTGAKSARILNGMLADEQFAAEFDRDGLEEVARKTYTQAQAYKQNDLDQTAAKLLSTLLSSYGQTEWAGQARRDLKDDPALAALVTQTEVADTEPAEARSARLRRTVQQILARAPQVVPDQASGQTKTARSTPVEERYPRLIESLGPVLVNASKQRVPTSSLKTKKRVLLYYSASWCGSCHKFTPKLKAFYEANKSDTNFEVILVSGDSSAKDMYRYMADSKMPWLAVPMSRIDASGLLNDYEVVGFPHLVLIDGNGDVVSNSVVKGRYLGPDNVLSEIQKDASLTDRQS